MEQVDPPIDIRDLAPEVPDLLLVEQTGPRLKSPPQFADLAPQGSHVALDPEQ